MGKLKNEFAWSFSRMGTLEDCPRRYYYRHFGFWGGWEDGADPKTKELYRLGKLEQRATWKGRVVHDAISRALWRAREGRPVVGAEEVDDFLADLLHSMRKDYQDSRDDVARATGRIKWHVRFLEHEREMDTASPEWRRRWKQTADEVERGLRNFLGSKLHATLRELPEEDWIELERSGASLAPSFELDGVRVFVKVDCAYREGGRPILVDWKSGRSLSPATPVQLAIYALYLQEQHGIDPAELTAREINVVTGESAEHDVGPEALETFRSVFAESIREMRSYLEDVDGNVPKPEEEFPFARNEARCEWCNFRSACAKFT